ncbi:ASCH domain-containing protein [Anaerospora hongkongensis]|uniref:ASCH domain-containing protein n=1 Tax=Anaerospora hongkongensis TaxID=244830 RepID=UPI0028A10BA9|nr:ASCH domain-containing protein [Anaerospora hongkongensis]
MFALNFQAPHHEELLLSRAKNCTIRLGDVQETYPENSIVWITFGKKFGPRKKLYPAIIDRVLIKQYFQLTSEDLAHQNPEIKSVEELISFFEKLYGRTITPNDYVSVIYFSEIVEE